jgi:hypothetical protein
MNVSSPAVILINRPFISFMSPVEECKLRNMCGNHTRNFLEDTCFIGVHLLKYKISTAMSDVTKRG